MALSNSRAIEDKVKVSCVIVTAELQGESQTVHDFVAEGDFLDSMLEGVELKFASPSCPANHLQNEAMPQNQGPCQQNIKICSETLGRAFIKQAGIFLSTFIRLLER